MIYKFDRIGRGAWFHVNIENLSIDDKEIDTDIFFGGDSEEMLAKHPNGSPRERPWYKPGFSRPWYRYSLEQEKYIYLLLRQAIRRGKNNKHLQSLLMSCTVSDRPFREEAARDFCRDHDLDFDNIKISDWRKKEEPVPKPVSEPVPEPPSTISKKLRWTAVVILSLIALFKSEFYCLDFVNEHDPSAYLLNGFFRGAPEIAVDFFLMGLGCMVVFSCTAIAFALSTVLCGIVTISLNDVREALKDPESYKVLLVATLAVNSVGFLCIICGLIFLLFSFFIVWQIVFGGALILGALRSIARDAWS